jgi:hypothetical protein
MNLGFSRVAATARTAVSGILENRRRFVDIAFAWAVLGIGNQIHTSAREWMATGKAPNRKP